MIHILGIAGTFMAGVAALAKESNIPVSGSDAGVYPPMSTLLDTLGVNVTEGYEQTDILDGKTIVIGNALSRGNPAVEYTLAQKLPYLSGPQWLLENVLRKKTVLAIAGTHGKTSTAAMLAWILQATDQAPGFLIGGKPGNFARSAQLGESELFVVEADEYDTAFFDKRSKFVHYHPHIAVLNNLEFDHADIFPDIDAIKTQFHHFVRTIPQNGRLIVNMDEANLADVIKMGCWTPVDYFSVKDEKADWFAHALDATANHFSLRYKGEKAQVKWSGMGEHNMSNALAAIAAAHYAGVSITDACHALQDFRFPNKRLQRHDTNSGFTLYEDFAHHPTAIAKTLTALRDAHPEQRIIALLELRSNTMKMGYHQQTLVPSLMDADIACIVSSADVDIDMPGKQHRCLQQFTSSAQCFEQIKALLTPEDVVITMSNGDFDGVIDKFKHI